MKISSEANREAPRPTKRRTLSNFLDALAAVLAGNAIYFLIMPHLPPNLRHAMFKEDWGLAVDFGICAILFIAIKLTLRRPLNS
ncbi:MAG TPA: hypothetical protein VMI10_19390 [Terriglobales bacterium]|nr:hypothetical protein [Terriglobales bacterium]